MKAKPISIKQEFTPVTIALTFETQDELDLFASMANTASITEAMEDLGLDIYNPLLLDMGGDRHKYCSRITEAIKEKLKDI